MRKSGGNQNNGCIKNASIKFPVENSLYALVIPQDGQGNPDSLYSGHWYAPKRISVPRIKKTIYFFIGILYSIFRVISSENKKIVALFSVTIFSLQHLTVFLGHISAKLGQRNCKFYKPSGIVGKLVRRKIYYQRIVGDVKVLVFAKLWLCPKP